MRSILIAIVLCSLSACDRTAEERHAAEDAPSAAKAEADPLAAEPHSEAADTSRMVIRQARVEVQTETVDDAASALGGLAERFGGYVERSDGNAEDGGFRRFEATLRIPGEQFEPATGIRANVPRVCQWDRGRAGRRPRGA